MVIIVSETKISGLSNDTKSVAIGRTVWPCTVYQHDGGTNGRKEGLIGRLLIAWRTIRSVNSKTDVTQCSSNFVSCNRSFVVEHIGHHNSRLVEIFILTIL